MISRYRVALLASEEGFSASCPGLPGCWSQGVTEAEALDNIRDAIREYLGAVADSLYDSGTGESNMREVEVSVQAVPKLPGIPHLRAVRALEKAGFTVAREGSRHIVMSKGGAFVTIPRHDPVNAYTMGGIIRDAGLTVEEFRKLL